MITRFIISALFAGALAGLITGLLQLWFVQPVLLHAELYETGALVHFGADPVSAHPDLPGFDLMRDGLSVIFTMLTYTGYALMLVAVMSLAEERGAQIDGRSGMIWGIAGFVAFHLAPGFTLAPEVPGVAAADVAARQVWWFATAGAAAVGLGGRRDAVAVEQPIVEMRLAGVGPLQRIELKVTRLGVAEQRAQLEALHLHRDAHRRQIVGHISVTVGFFPCAFPVIAHIHRNHLTTVRHAFRDDAPVSRRPVKTVNNQQGGQICPIAMSNHIQHMTVLTPGHVCDQCY